MQKDGFELVKKTLSESDRTVLLSPKQREELQQTLLHMLWDFIDVCEKNHIRYSLSGGSVLGSIRHKGFIPWDDDIDINMPRKSFECLKKIFDRELGENYILDAPECSRAYGRSLVQFKKKNTLYRIFNNLDEQKNRCGICIDIFVLENVPDHPLLRKLHGTVCLGMGYLLNCRKVVEYLPPLAKLLQDEALLERCFHTKRLVGTCLKWIPLDLLTKLTYAVYSLCRNDHSAYVTIPSGRGHYFGEMAERDDMCRYVKGQFCGRTVSLPKGYDRYMHRLYGPGDYMIPPPEGDREMHPIIEYQNGKTHLKADR